MGIVLAKKFIRQISQPFDHSITGISLWTLEDIETRQKQQKEEEERELREAGVALQPRDPEAIDEPPEPDGMDWDEDELANIPMPVEAS